MYQFTVEGFHKWQEAPPEYEYLSARHRHLFVVKVAIPTPGDRKIEFIAAKRAMRETFRKRWGEPCEFGNLSCEKIAEATVAILPVLSRVTVLEDGENGATVYS